MYTVEHYMVISKENGNLTDYVYIFILNLNTINSINIMVSEVFKCRVKFNKRCL